MVNFDRKGLTLDELETLLHEFGHAVHNNLSATRYVVAGRHQHAARLRRGAVADARGLGLRPAGAGADSQEVCPPASRCPTRCWTRPRPPSTTARAVAYARPVAAMRPSTWRLHGADAPEPMALWARMEGATPLGHVPGTHVPGRLRPRRHRLRRRLLRLPLERGGGGGPAHRVRATTGSTPRSGSATAAPSWPAARSCKPRRTGAATSSAARQQPEGVLRRAAALSRGLSRGRVGYSTSDAKSARRERSPRASVTWPAVRPALEAVDRVGQARACLR